MDGAPARGKDWEPDSSATGACRIPGGGQGPAELCDILVNGYIVDIMRFKIQSSGIRQ